jgi:tetratricopeptide (TPR) repeat protein
LRSDRALGNYCTVTTRRLIRTIAPALLAGCLLLQGCTREAPPAPPPAEPARDVFHATKPLRLQVVAQPNEDGVAADLSWLERELRYLLTRGQMLMTPQSTSATTYVLQVGVTPDGKQAHLRLVAPDEVIERKSTVEIAQANRLATVAALAGMLPAFLEASHASQDWKVFIGTEDEYAYETYVRSASDVFGAAAQGATRPASSRPRGRTVERLERLTRAHPRFARAWATLAAGYLSLGGKDLPSLTDLAESSAERALRLDENIAEAHAALGLVDLRRNDWIAAQEKFEWALFLDANMPLALEGLACLHVDAGHYRASLPHGRRAVALQPRNAGANECLTYAQLGALDGSEAVQENGPLLSSVARVRALSAFLAGERRTAERLLRSSMSRTEFDLWAAPLIRAARDRRLVPDALKAITRAANDGHIDAATEILCGAALREPEFVFNRIERLQNETAHAPLRLLWLPQADFLRKHERFEATISKAGLTAFWHGSGPPDVCASEPAVYGCNLTGDRKAKKPLLTSNK